MSGTESHPPSRESRTGSTILGFFVSRTIVELSWLVVIVVFVGLSFAYADVRRRY